MTKRQENEFKQIHFLKSEKNALYKINYKFTLEPIILNAPPLQKQFQCILYNYNSTQQLVLRESPVSLLSGEGHRTFFYLARPQM